MNMKYKKITIGACLSILIVVLEGYYSYRGKMGTIRNLPILESVSILEDHMEWGGMQEDAWWAWGKTKSRLDVPHTALRSQWILCGSLPLEEQWDSPSCDWYQGVREFHARYPEIPSHRLLFYKAKTHYAGIDSRSPCLIVADPVTGLVHISLWGQWPSWR